MISPIRRHAKMETPAVAILAAATPVAENAHALIQQMDIRVAKGQA